MSEMGIIVIGRNEGARLAACLRSLRPSALPVVYVDSGSSDGSPRLAREMGVEVVELDAARPFSAARGRNEGFHRLIALHPDLKYIHFVDGDCEMAGEWLEAGRRRLEQQPALAAVCGHLHERFPEASIYNRLCELEWSREVGPVEGTGGIFTARASCFEAVGGFNPDVVAGEEADLCFRWRQRGWGAERIAVDMAWHDAAMTRFGQWWRRAVRSGFSYAEGLALHVASSERHNLRPVLSILFWGLALPAMIVATLWPTRGLSVLGAGLYPVLWWRIRRRRIAGGEAASLAGLYATFCILAKFAQVVGVGRYLWRRLLRQKPRIIEYKTPAACPVEGAAPAQS